MPAFLTTFWSGLPRWAQSALLWLGVGLLIFLTGKAYGAAKEHQGAQKQKAKDANETRNNLDRIERKADEHIEQADRIRAANPVSGDPDRVSDRPIADYNYRN